MMIIAIDFDDVQFPKRPNLYSSNAIVYQI